MSYWTHIVGVLYVDTYTETDDLVGYIEDKLKDAPAITGSERNASIYINVPPGHNVSTSFDCARCEYGSTLRHYPDGFECYAPEHYDCPTGEYMTRAIITVQGDLRDRMFDQTHDEWLAFRRYLENDCDFRIRQVTSDIRG